MKNFTILPLALLVLSGGAVKSQAPVTSSGVVTSLQAIISANKDLINKQQKTLDGLDQLLQNADQLKTFTRRS